MFHLVTAKAVPLTTQLAAEIQRLPTFKGDRSLKEHRVEFLRDKLQKDQFHTPNWVTAVYRGTKYRINGNHSSHVLLTSKPLPDLQVFLEEFTCDDEEDLAAVWGQYDSLGSARSTNEVINAAIRIHPELDKIGASTVAAIVAGIAYYDNEGSVDAVSPLERQELVHKHVKFVRWAIQWGGNKSFKRAPVLAAVYGTWQSDPAKAGIFWTQVRDESAPDVNHPTRVLNRFLRESTSRQNGTLKSKFPSFAFYVKCVLAWNAAQAGRPTDLKWYPEAYLGKKGSIKKFPCPD